MIFLLLAAVLLFSQAAPTCGPNQTYYSQLNTCLHLNDSVHVTRDDAEKQCVAMGHLPSIHSGQQNADFAGIIRKLHKADTFIWLGCVGSRIDGIIWTDGSPDDYTRWDGSFAEDLCNGVSTGNGLWTNIYCETKAVFACYIPAR